MNNHARYRAMSEPHANRDAANAAVQAFMADVEAAREKHRITNIYLSVATFMISANGETVEIGSHAGWGDELRMESLVAHTLGQLQRDRQNRIAELMSPTKAGGMR